MSATFKNTEMQLKISLHVDSSMLGEEDIRLAIQQSSSKLVPIKDRQKHTFVGENCFLSKNEN
jgi:hypothetical protein